MHRHGDPYIGFSPCGLENLFCAPGRRLAGKTFEPTYSAVGRFHAVAKLHEGERGGFCNLEFSRLLHQYLLGLCSRPSSLDSRNWSVLPGLRRRRHDRHCAHGVLDPAIRHADNLCFWFQHLCQSNDQLCGAKIFHFQWIKRARRGYLGMAQASDFYERRGVTPMEIASSTLGMLAGRTLR
jgi:hypothetical protein